jgi:hypothetical protein
MADSNDPVMQNQDVIQAARGAKKLSDALTASRVAQLRATIAGTSETTATLTKTATRKGRVSASAPTRSAGKRSLA